MTITASAQSKTYGQTVTFSSGSTQFTSSGLENGETIGSVTLAVTNNGGAATAAAGGSYTITASAATGGTFTASNYSITYDTGTLTVNTAALTITASDQSKTYGQTVTFSSGSTQFTSSGLENGETIGSVTVAVTEQRRCCYGRRRQLHDNCKCGDRRNFLRKQLQHHLRYRHPDGQHRCLDHHG